MDGVSVDRSEWTGVCVRWECGRSESGPSECGAQSRAPRPAPASWVRGARRACPAAPPPGSAARGRVSGAVGLLGVLGVPSGAAAGAASVPAPLERQTRGAQAPAEPPAGGRRWARRAALARPRSCTRRSVLRRRRRSAGSRDHGVAPQPGLGRRGPHHAEPAADASGGCALRACDLAREEPGGQGPWPGSLGTASEARSPRTR